MIKTQAFLLRENQYKSSSVIATFITESSNVDAICYRVKKSSKNIGSDLSITAKLNIILDGTGKSLYRLHESAIIKDYSILHDNLETSLMISYIKEILLYISQGTTNDECFMLMEKTLDAMVCYIESGYSQSINILMRAFEIKCLSICGIVPSFTKCILCAKQESKYWNYIFEMGTVICEDCYKKSTEYKRLHSQVLSNDILNILRQLKHKPLMYITQNITNIKDYSSETDNIIKLISLARIKDYIGHGIKSAEIIDSMLL